MSSALHRMVSSSQVSDWFNQDGDLSVPSRIGKTLDIPNTGLQLYLDANNLSSYSGSGTTWNDISGNNRNFTWTSSPSYNSSGIKYFNTLGYGANGPASNSFGINNTSGYTFLFTMYQNALYTTGAFKWYSSNAGTRGIFAHATWSDANIYWDQGGCCGADTRTNVGLSNSTGNWHVIGLRCNYAGTSRTIWDNGTILTTNASGIANINLSATAANVGYTDEYGTSWNARIGQFAVYNRSLSDTEMTSVTNTFKSKVGL
jgi:hypothetical protein